MKRPVALIWAHAAVGVPWFNQIQRSPAISCWAHAVFAIVFGHSAHPHLKHLTCSRSALRSAVIQVPTIVFISSTVMAKRPRHEAGAADRAGVGPEPGPLPTDDLRDLGRVGPRLRQVPRDADRRANLALEATGRVGAVAAFEGLREDSARGRSRPATWPRRARASARRTTRYARSLLETGRKVRNRRNPRAPAVSHDGRYGEPRRGVNPEPVFLSLFLALGDTAARHRAIRRP